MKEVKLEDFQLIADERFKNTFFTANSKKGTPVSYYAKKIIQASEEEIQYNIYQLKQLQYNNFTALKYPLCYALYND